MLCYIGLCNLIFSGFVTSIVLRALIFLSTRWRQHYLDRLNKTIYTTMPCSSSSLFFLLLLFWSSLSLYYASSQLQSLIRSSVGPSVRQSVIPFSRPLVCLPVHFPVYPSIRPSVTYPKERNYIYFKNTSLDSSSCSLPFHFFLLFSSSFCS